MERSRLHSLLGWTIILAVARLVHTGEMKTPGLLGKTYDQLEIEARTAYANQNWQEAVDKFEEAIADYHLEQRGMTECFQQCEADAVRKNQPDDASTDQTEQDSDPDNAFIRRLIERATCEQTCSEETLGLRGPVLDEVKYYFEEARPYEFLHYAYYKVIRACGFGWCFAVVKFPKQNCSVPSALASRSLEKLACTCTPPTHTHTHTHTRAHARTHAARTPARTHTLTHACTHAHTHARMHARTRTHAHTHTHTHTHTLRVYVCAHAHTP